MLSIRRNIDHTSHCPQSPKALSVCNVLPYTCHTGLLEIYQQLLGLKFTEVKDTETWSVDVQLVRIHLVLLFFLDIGY